MKLNDWKESFFFIVGTAIGMKVRGKLVWVFLVHKLIFPLTVLKISWVMLVLNGTWPKMN